jgi:hypothetical protein
VNRPADIERLNMLRMIRFAMVMGMTVAGGSRGFAGLPLHDPRARTPGPDADHASHDVDDNRYRMQR